jgi:glutamine synthetase
MHCDDALRMADDAWLFKMLVKGTARRHGMAASFLAKPNEEDAGNGMHVHCSVLDEVGANIFDDGGPQGTPALGHAISGCLSAMADTTLIFAPHAGSYARLVPGAHAPTGIAWAYDNRTAAIRVPDSAPAARRIEHRVAGGDANPYLLLAAILGAMFDGLEQAKAPPPPITGNAYALDLPRIPDDWDSAITRFAQGPLSNRIFAPMLIDNMTRTKRQEQATTQGLDHEALTRLYLNRV